MGRRRQSRSKMDHMIGPDLDLFFQADVDVMRHLKRMWDKGEAPNEKRWRTREMFKDNRTTPRGDGKYETENDIMDLDWDGGKAIKHMMTMVRLLALRIFMQ